MNLNSCRFINGFHVKQPVLVETRRNIFKEEAETMDFVMIKNILQEVVQKNGDFLEIMLEMDAIIIDFNRMRLIQKTLVLKVCYQFIIYAAFRTWCFPDNIKRFDGFFPVRALHNVFPRAAIYYYSICRCAVSGCW